MIESVISKTLNALCSAQMDKAGQMQWTKLLVENDGQQNFFPPQTQSLLSDIYKIKNVNIIHIHRNCEWYLYQL